MALETVTTINTLNATNPTSTDPASQGDDHIRNIKSALKTTFPNITGPMTVTQTVLNGLDAAKANKTVTLTGGDGITDVIGDLSADRSISVDATVARKNVNNEFTALQEFKTGAVVTGGELELAKGYFNIGPYNVSFGTGYLQTYYSANDTSWVITGRNAANAAVPVGIRVSKTPSVPTELTNKAYVDLLDQSNVKTTGAQSIAGVKTFTDVPNLDSGSVYIRGAAASNKHVWFRDSDNAPRGIVYADGANDKLSIATYNSSAVQTARLSLNKTGAIVADVGYFAGSGSGLNSVPASALTGTVANARMVGNYSWDALDLAGRLLVTTSDNYANPGVVVQGAAPNIHLRQTDGEDAFLAVNENFFFVLADTNGDLTYDNVALSVNLTGAGVTHRGTLLAYQTNSVTAGNGLTGGGQIGTNPTITLGTPTSITATSTNTVTTNSHTHDFPNTELAKLYATLATGAIGTIAFATNTGTAVSPGGTTAGANLSYAGESDGARTSTGTLTGTWRCMGYAPNNYNTAWMRIS